VSVKLPTFENLYAGALTCERIYGHDLLGHHELCVATVAEHLER